MQKELEAKQAKVAVVVPIYNVEKYLGECIESIINQSYKNLEIVLVDDGSSDSSGEIAMDYFRRDSRISLIYKCNGGVGSAKNAAIEYLLSGLNLAMVLESSNSMHGDEGLPAYIFRASLKNTAKSLANSSINPAKNGGGGGQASTNTKL